MKALKILIVLICLFAVIAIASDFFEDNPRSSGLLGGWVLRMRTYGLFLAGLFVSGGICAALALFRRRRRRLESEDKAKEWSDTWET